jgi:hypothetical protein
MPPASYRTPRQSIDALNHTRLFIKKHEVVFALRLTDDVGRFTGNYGSPEFWKVWGNGSWRLGTTLNDIRPRNIGAAGQIFDPAVEQHAGFLFNSLARGVAPRFISPYQPLGDGR